MDDASIQSLTPDTPVQYVKGIGPKRAALLARVDIRTVEDLLTYFPRKHLDRSHVTPIRAVQENESVTIMGKVLSRQVAQGRKKRFILVIGDGTGLLDCIWFRGIQYISKTFEVGETVAFSGKVTFFRGPQLVHPEYDKISEEGETDPLHTGGIIPLYPSTEILSKQGLDSRGFRRIVQAALGKVRETLKEILPESILRNQNLISYLDALQNIHFPNTMTDLKKAETRLKFEELFFIQLYLALQRKHREFEEEGIEFNRVGEQTQKLVKSLPFELTEAQKRVLREIRQDMKAKRPMSRLLQGDVGSGKTIVALTAMLIAVENGYQAALMAPTEILAEQHYITIHDQLEAMGIRVALIKGSLKGSEKKEIADKLSRGEIEIAIGTHALVQKGVSFHKLGFVVIDEQHRFGVLQRAALMQKGILPDVLVMTATPIPRTLALTLYGDLDVSVIDEMPKGRKSVRTVWRRENKREAIYDYIRTVIQEGNQVYIVYPLVEESEKVDLAAATEGYETLSRDVFPEFNIALLHGRMKARKKEEVMKDFKSGRIQILVCTTVVEVGVDVPGATVMLVEHAERFGLTQLHQLRGRVGRGEKESTCILITQGGLSEDADKRIRVMVDTTDGFRIAESDMEIRGPGELFGTRQHGELSLKIANLTVDGRILEKARKEAFLLVENDPHLEQIENRILRETYSKRYKERFGLMKVG